MVKQVNLIISTDANYGIGSTKQLCDKGMLWKYKTDMINFRRLTTYTEQMNKKNALIVGRITSELIGELTDRLMIVVSRTGTSIEQAIKQCNDDETIDKIFVVGGKMIYDLFLTRYVCMINTVYYTFVHRSFYTDIFIDKDKIFNNDFSIESEYTYTDNNDTLTYYVMKNNRHKYGEYQYINVLECLLNKDRIENRNGKTYSDFGKELVFDLTNTFPLITTKKCFMRGIFEELKFFVSGCTNTKILEDKGINIWKLNTQDTNGEMGPMYGYQWRNYNGEGKDQLTKVINDIKDSIKTGVYSRRILMTSYNPLQAEQGVLYPCHGIVLQFYVQNGTLSCAMYQRSCDVLLGLPFNIASYSLLLLYISSVCKLRANKMHIYLADYHLYAVHEEQAKEQITRIPYTFPSLKINKELNTIDDIVNMEYTDIDIIGYEHHNAIKALMVA